MFTVSVISEDADFALFEHFGFQSGRDVDKFADFADCKSAQNGTMIITKGTNAFISATYTYYHQNIKPKPQTFRDGG